MTTIYQFPLPISPPAPLAGGEMNIIVQNARLLRVLSVGFDPEGVACIWAEVVPAHGSMDELRAYNCWTGWTTPEDYQFIGTLVHGNLVNHIFVEQPKIQNTKSIEQVIVAELCGEWLSPESVAERIVVRLKNMGVING